VPPSELRIIGLKVCLFNMYTLCNST